MYYQQKVYKYICIFPPSSPVRMAWASVQHFVISFEPLVLHPIPLLSCQTVIFRKWNGQLSVKRYGNIGMPEDASGGAISRYCSKLSLLADSDRA